MPTDSPTPTTIAVTPGSGILLDAVEVTVATNTVDRECIVIADPANGDQYAEVNPQGVQADNFLGVAQAHDTGRSILHWSIPAQTASSSSTAAAVTNITQNSDFTQTTGVTAFEIPSGQTLRITNVGGVAAAESTTTTTTSRWVMIIQVRVATTNTTTAIAAGVIAAEVAIPIALATAAGLESGWADVAYSEGVEIPYGNAAGNYVGFTFLVQGTAETSILLEAHVLGYVY